MKTKAIGVVLASVAALVSLFACSGTSGGLGGDSCVSAAAGQSCYACAQGSCASQLSNFESACSAYLSCICPGGSFSCSAALSGSCTTMEMSSSCEAAGQAISACTTQSCEGQCGEDVCGGGGGDGGGGGTSTVCSSQFNADGSTCVGGQALEFCTTTTGGVSSCYYSVGPQQFSCPSCSSTTSCEQAAAAVCQ